MSPHLRINVLVSRNPRESFDKTSTPLIARAFEANGHRVTLVSAEHPPPFDQLLDCDVFLDRSPITETVFLHGLARAFRLRRIARAARPLMVDNPLATIVASDKRRTHTLFPRLIPQSYELDGVNNTRLISGFLSEPFVVIKDPLSWNSKGVERLPPSEALEKYATAQGLVLQRYVPTPNGVCRIVTANFDADFRVLAAYRMVPDSWRTGIDVTTRFETIPCPPELYRFARSVTRRSGIYLNGIDYIEAEGGFVLLETNTVPNLRVPVHYLGVDAPRHFVAHVERSVARRCG